MLLNKKCVYLGVTLFSALILTTVSGHTVKADTTTDSTNTTNTTNTSNTTSGTASTTNNSTSTTPSVTDTSNSTTSTTPSGTDTSNSTTNTTPSSTGTTNNTTSTTPSSTGTTNSTTSTTPSSTGTTNNTTSTTPSSTGTTNSTTSTTPSSTGTTNSSTGTTPSSTGTANSTTSTTPSDTGTTNSNTSTTPSGTGTTSTTPSTTNTTSTTVTTPTMPADIVYSTIDLRPQSPLPVQIYDGTGAPVTGSKTSLKETAASASATINGQLYYMIGTDQWVPASDYDTFVSETGLVRTLNAPTSLFDAAGAEINAELNPNTEWRYNNIVTINGEKYYEVATDEYLDANDAIKFTLVPEGTAVTSRSASVLYNSQGQRISAMLPAGSNWKTDGCSYINGIPMYRIANDEWVAEQDVDTYTNINLVYAASFDTPVYNIDGNMLPLNMMLKAGTTWKIDRVVTINGGRYYRVAPNEFIPDLAYDVGTSEGVVEPKIEHITVPRETTIYDSEGNPTATTVPAGSSCYTSAEEVLHGVPMYKVGVNEWVRMSDIDSYNQTSNDTVYIVANTELYNSKGQLITNILPVDTAWKTGGTITINGQKYIRVATDEYIKANV